MQIKGKYSWLKHVDFMLWDIVALCLSYFIAFVLKFGNKNPLANENWRLYLLIIVTLNVMVNLFMNPYSGILRRSYYMEFITVIKTTVINLIVASLFLYVLKMGASFSREMTLTMYGMYFVVSLILKYIWKKMIVSGIIVTGRTRSISLFIIGSESNIEQTIESVNAGDFKLYEIKGIHLIDSDRESF